MKGMTGLFNGKPSVAWQGNVTSRMGGICS
jgi:hypothetical protein